MKNGAIAILIIVVLVLGGYVLMRGQDDTNIPNGTNDVANGSLSDGGNQAMATTTDQTNGRTVIGKSVNGADIVAYHYGTGEEEILLVGGIHGGYSWNTGWLANDLAIYLSDIGEEIPTNLKVTVIAQLNPDGIAEVVGTLSGETLPSDFISAPLARRVAGRFNANDVDLNRNFDCNWKPEGIWQDNKVSGGTAPFSEPESKAVKDYIESHKIKAVIVYYSAAGGVYSSACNAGILSETSNLTTVYAKASGYPAYQKFDAYQTSGDMANWLAKIKIPAISVLLTNHEEIEKDRNIAGLKAVLTNYSR